MSELKCCPFCGGRGRTDTEEVAYTLLFRVECSRCDVRTPLYDTVEQAYSAWNTRTPDREQIRFTLVQSGWPVKLPSREEFEFWYSDQGKSPRAVEKSADGYYKLMGATQSWIAWQAALASIPQPPFTDLDAAVETIAMGLEQKQKDKQS